MRGFVAAGRLVSACLDGPGTAVPEVAGRSWRCGAMLLLRGSQWQSSENIKSYTTRKGLKWFSCRYFGPCLGRSALTPGQVKAQNLNLMVSKQIFALDLDLKLWLVDFTSTIQLRWTILFEFVDWQ